MAFPTLNILCKDEIDYTGFRKLCIIHTETIVWLLWLSI